MILMENACLRNDRHDLSTGMAATQNAMEMATSPANWLAGMLLLPVQVRGVGRLNDTFQR